MKLVTNATLGMTAGNLMSSAVGTRQRLPDEQSLPGHGHALPVRLEECLPAHIVVEKNRGTRELTEMIAGFGNRAVRSGGALTQPFQRRHLYSSLENPAGGSQMIRRRTGPKLKFRQFVDARGPGEIADDADQRLLNGRRDLAN